MLHLSTASPFGARCRTWASFGTLSGDRFSLKLDPPGLLVTRTSTNANLNASYWTIDSACCSYLPSRPVGRCSNGAAHGGPLRTISCHEHYQSNVANQQSYLLFPHQVSMLRSRSFLIPCQAVCERSTSYVGPPKVSPLVPFYLKI